jgi:hypothetical protein
VAVLWSLCQMQLHRKLEDWALQYSTHLSSQLEQQRQFYEHRLLELRAAASQSPCMTGEQVNLMGG